MKHLFRSAEPQAVGGGGRNRDGAGDDFSLDQNIISTVSGEVVAVSSVITYIIAEGRSTPPLSRRPSRRRKRRGRRWGEKDGTAAGSPHQSSGDFSSRPVTASPSRGSLEDGEMLYSTRIEDLRGCGRQLPGVCGADEGRGLQGAVVNTVGRGDAAGALRQGRDESKGADVPFVKAGLAFDICQGVAGHGYDNEEFWDKAGTLGTKIGFEWGWHWKGFPEKPHF
jgi:hypothetical protein